VLKRAFVGMAFVIGVIASVISLRLVAGDETGGASVGRDLALEFPGPPPPEPDQSQLPAAKAVTLSEAQEGFPFKLYLPNDELASDATSSAVWYQDPSLGPAVELQYSSGLRVLYQLDSIGNEETDSGEEKYDPVANFADIANRLAGQAAEYLGGSPSDYLAEVKDGTSYVVPYRIGVNSAVVKFSIPDGVIITILGEYELTELLQVAESVE
jgi:hypothetical protein